uniref:Uncharacterized protein n=1 Tax=Sander lucioperca TaxID=283035 RepID=A0A8C9ZHD9_SANLU
MSSLQRKWSSHGTQTLVKGQFIWGENRVISSQFGFYFGQRIWLLYSFSEQTVNTHSLLCCFEPEPGFNSCHLWSSCCILLLHLMTLCPHSLFLMLSPTTLCVFLFEKYISCRTFIGKIPLNYIYCKCIYCI